VLALAVPPNSEQTLVGTYSDRLMRNFAVSRDYRRDLAAATRPITIFAGADDELMFADKYAEAVRGAPVPVDVKLIDGVNHMGIVSAPRAISIVADEDRASRERIVMTIEGREAAAGAERYRGYRSPRAPVADLPARQPVADHVGRAGVCRLSRDLAQPTLRLYAWPAVYVVGIAGSVVISVSNRMRSASRTFDARMLAAFVSFIAFGIFSSWLGHFGPRQLSTFWPIYFMLIYTIAGLWVGYAFVAIGLSIIVLTLVGYFFIGDAFDLWMASSTAAA
jgi:hypothetical protein